MISKIGKRSLLGFLVFCCYLYTSQVMLSPVYFGFFMALIIGVASIFVTNARNVVDANFFLGLLGLGYALVILDRVSDFGTYINYVMCMVLIASYSLIFKSVNLRVSGIRPYLVFIILLLYVFECAYRLNNPIYTQAMLSNEDESLIFYPYKYNSIMFIDSNFVGLSLISFIATVDIILNKSKIKFLFITALVILLALTFSRAALISILIYFSIKRVSLKSLVLFAVFLLLFSVYAVPMIISDGSYLSKIKILNYFNQYLINADCLTILLGSGVGSSADVLGIGSHNLFVLLVVEFGLISLLGFFSFIVINLIQTSFKSFPYWLSILVCGFSLGSIYVFIFIPALLLINHSKHSENPHAT
jgi:hypothetical protein